MDIKEFIKNNSDFEFESDYMDILSFTSENISFAELNSVIALIYREFPEVNVDYEMDTITYLYICL